MVSYNKYLKELGIKETDYPFANDDGRISKPYKVNKEGFRPAELYSLDYSLSLYIYSQLCYFRDNCLMSYPVYMSFEKWKSIINKMIKAFELIIVNSEKTFSKNQMKQIHYGLRLFAKYYFELWY